MGRPGFLRIELRVVNTLLSRTSHLQSTPTPPTHVVMNHTAPHTDRPKKEIHSPVPSSHAQGSLRCASDTSKSILSSLQPPTKVLRYGSRPPPPSPSRRDYQRAPPATYLAMRNIWTGMLFSSALAMRKTCLVGQRLVGQSLRDIRSVIAMS